MIWEGLTPPYATVVADPPWPVELDYGPRKGARHGTAAPYQVMTIWEICALPVRDLTAKDAHLYLWITPALNRQGIGVQVARAWGFRVYALTTPGRSLNPSAARPGHARHEPAAGRGDLVTLPRNRNAVAYRPYG